MEAPNTIEAIQAEKDIQLLDPNLRLVWNPSAFISTPGCFDAYGNIVPARYEGRWQVQIKGYGDGELTVVHTLGSETDATKPYRSPGPWLVQYLREWDAAQRHFMESMKKAMEEEERMKASAESELWEKGEEELNRFAAEQGAKNHWTVPAQIN